MTSIDLSTVPLIATTAVSREVFATKLNSIKVLPSDNDLPRDWRGLAHQLEFSTEVVTLLKSDSNPTMHILTMLEKNPKDITIKQFQEMMEQMDRWDVIDDTEALFQKDAERYLEHQQRAQVSVTPIDESADREILTFGDIDRLRKGLEAQRYDALLLYVEEDIDFAKEIVKKLEMQFKLKLCLKDRDLVAGVQFEYEAIMKLITERCNRLLVILSPIFMKNPANIHILKYAHALGIEKEKRKIIPCIYKNCELPYELKYIYHLDYNRKGQFYDFWDKLRNSLEVPNCIAMSSSTQTENSNVAQEATEVKKTLSDEYNNLLQRDITPKINEELKNQQKSEHCKSEVIAKESNVETSNVSDKNNKTRKEKDKKRKDKKKNLFDKLVKKKIAVDG